MGRVNELKNYASLMLNRIKSGTHQKRKYRKSSIFKFIDSFYMAGYVPANWHMVTKENIESTIGYWRKKGLTDDSIRMHIADIRYFLQVINHNIEGIENKALGLSRTAEKKKIPFKNDYLQKVSDPISHLILSLQIEFGLTLSESMRFNPDLHIKEGYIMLTRDITYDSKDRVIIIYCETQRKLIIKARQILETNSSPIFQFGYSSVRERYRFEIKRIRLTPSVNYRYVYAKNRMNFLTETHNKDTAFNVIIDEMSISKCTLRRYLHE